MISLLPPNWSLVKFKNVVKDFKRGPFGSAIKKSFFVNEGYKVYEQKNAIYNSYKLGDYFINEDKYNELERFEVGPNDYIVSCSGTIGKIYQLPKHAPKGVINQALLRIRLDNSIIVDKYFLELFQSSLFQKKILVETRGSAMVNIAGVKELKEIPIWLPPLSEQKKIVEKIEELFSQLESGVASLKKAKDQIKLYRQSVLASAFSGELTSKKEKVKSQKTENALPEDWEWVKVKEISDDMMIGIVKSNKDQINDKNATPYIKMNNVSTDGKVDLNNVVFVNVTNDELEKFRLLKGDLLFNTRNSFELVGKTGIVTDDKIKRVFNNNLLRIRVKNEYDPVFINYQMNSQFFREKLKTGKRATTNICAIYQKDLFPMELKFPSLEQQKQIVEEIEKRFSEADNLEKAIDESLQKAEQLKQSILKRAFEGKLV